MSEVHEDLIEITKYEVLDKLPNPFTFDNGTPLKSPDDWAKRKAEIYKTAVELQYGTMPPTPEFLEVEPIYLGERQRFYRIISGTKENPVSFEMILFPAKVKNAPIVISGDFCFGYAFNKEYVDTFAENGVNLVFFDRTALAPDVAQYNINRFDKNSGEYAIGKKILDGLKAGNCGGQLKAAYPEYSFGAIGAWAWGYSRCVDAIEQLGFADMSLVAFTGHSRGGKTALLAGVLDERAAIVNPNGSGMCGCAGYRINVDIKTESGEVKPGEPLSNIFNHFPAWMGQGMKEYIGREQELPFDSHYLKALVAPRVLFDSEGASDHWANPVGTWQTNLAAKEVYKFLGCEENLLWYFRTGGHGQRVEDVEQLINVIKHIKDGEELNGKFFKLPFKPMPLEFDWKCPEI